MAAADWIDAVASQVEGDRNAVTEVLARYEIDGPKPVPTRTQLHVDALHFAGVKNLATEGDATARRFVAFSFSRRFGTPVTAFVSDGKNDAGKSSTLDILKWGLRGVSTVASDVQRWLRQVCLLLTIGGERILIAWRVDDGVPQGCILVLPEGVDSDLEALRVSAAESMTVHADQASRGGEPVFDLEVPVDKLVERLLGDGALRVAVFVGNHEMKLAIDEFMLQRFGLYRLTQWTRVANATDTDDGNLVDNGWQLWSQALAITKPSVSSVIGETPFHARNVLSTFLATEWGATALSARARRKAVDAQLAGILRRRSRDAEARGEGVQALRAARSEAAAELASIPVHDSSAEDIEAALTAVNIATGELTRTKRVMSDAALAYGTAERELHAAEEDLIALKEAAVTKRFWHALKPTCCPRCEAQVQPEHWAREQEGSCSLCSSPIVSTIEAADETSNDAPDSGIADDDNLDPVTLAQQRVTQQTIEVERLSALHEDAVAQAKTAQEEFERASEVIRNVHGDPVERRSIERRIAVLDGRIQERSLPSEADPEETALTNDSKVLQAAEVVANASAKSDFAEALASVSAQVTSLGRNLGVSNLEKAALRTNAHLPVIKGGEETPFGKLTDGEKLRLKIAVVVALLDVGTTSGMGRHPGLLIVDSLAAEELNQQNGESLLRELNRVAETHGLQVITSTANSELVAAVLPDEAMQRPTAEDLMW